MRLERMSRILRRLIRPPRIVGVTRRPAGWFAVGRRRLHDVVAWAQLEDGHIVGLVTVRRGLRPATGMRFRGYLPGAAHSGRDVQLSPPAIEVPVADVVEAIGDTWTSDEHGAIYDRLKIAEKDEWAGAALRAFIADPERFLRRHFEMLVEHSHPAELTDEWTADLAAINSQAVGAADAPRIHAKGGK